MGPYRKDNDFSIKKAIILAAGIGSRLRPFTNTVPKCLAPINRHPILINTLNNLSELGIQEIVIVVGYLKEKIYQEIGLSYKSMQVTYVVSDKFDTTNNIYSLWLAREYLTNDILLLESDIYFEKKLLEKMINRKIGNLAAVSKYHPWMSGTVVRIESNNRIHSFIKSKQQGPDFDFSDTFKTVNIYLFRKDFLINYFVPRLNDYISSGKVQEYYETILTSNEYQKKWPCIAIYCDDVKWYEIDDESDRLAAEKIFSI